MPSAVDILQAKREKAEGKTETPEQEINKVIEQVDDKIAVKTKKEDPIVEDSPIDDEEVDVDETVDDLIEENLDEDEVERLTAQQLKEAKDLYKALLNPAARGPLVQALAQQSGLNLSNIETKKEAKVAKKDITARLKEALGDELGFLADKMGPVIESVIEEERQGVEE